MSLVRDIVGGERMRSISSKLVAMFDDKAMEAEKDDITIVPAENIVISLSNSTSESFESLEPLGGWSRDIDPSGLDFRWGKKEIIKVNLTDTRSLMGNHRTTCKRKFFRGYQLNTHHSESIH